MALAELLEQNDPGPNVEWEKAGCVHDWRNYVPEVLREGWMFLSPTERAVAAMVARDVAQQEEWD